MNHDFTVREATPEDAQGITEVQFTAHQEVYASFLPEGTIQRANVDERTARWLTKIMEPKPNVFVAVNNHHVIGWSTSSLGRDIDITADWELEGLYTLSQCYGTGVGQALLEAATAGHPNVYLWVVEGNARAIAFYKRNGFIFDGSRKDAPLYDVAVPLLRMVKREI